MISDSWPRPVLEGAPGWLVAAAPLARCSDRIAVVARGEDGGAGKGGDERGRRGVLGPAAVGDVARADEDGIPLDGLPGRSRGGFGGGRGVVGSVDRDDRVVIDGAVRQAAVGETRGQHQFVAVERRAACRHRRRERAVDVVASQIRLAVRAPAEAHGRIACGRRQVLHGSRRARVLRKRILTRNRSRRREQRPVDPSARRISCRPIIEAPSTQQAGRRARQLVVLRAADLCTRPRHTPDPRLVQPPLEIPRRTPHRGHRGRQPGMLNAARLRRKATDHELLIQLPIEVQAPRGPVIRRSRVVPHICRHRRGPRYRMVPAVRRILEIGSQLPAGNPEEVVHVQVGWRVVLSSAFGHERERGGETAAPGAHERARTGLLEPCLQRELRRAEPPGTRARRRTERHVLTRAIELQRVVRRRGTCAATQDEQPDNAKDQQPRILRRRSHIPHSSERESPKMTYQ